MALVIKEWSVTGTPNDKGVCVYIKGREAGLWSFLMSLIGVDPTTTVTITEREILFEQGSFAGFVKRVIPLQNVCSTYYGFVKPWRQALALMCALWPLNIFAVLIALIYYWVSQELYLGFVENSGVINGIAFKRSVIEGINVDEEQATRVVDVISRLIRTSGEHTPVAQRAPPLLPASPPRAHAPKKLCAGCGEVLAAGAAFCEGCGKPVIL